MTAIVPTVGATAYPRKEGFDGYIGNILIRLAVAREEPFETMTADAAAQRIDTSDAAEDIRDEAGSRYSRSNLTGGAGMDFLHSPRRPSDSAIRYWDSKSVDVFGAEKGEAYAATLLHDMDLEESSAGIVRVAQIDGTVYYLSGADLREETVGSKDTLSATGIDLVAMGNSLYTMDGTDGVQRYDPPSWTPTNVSTTTTFTRIWGVKGRIVGVIDNLLYEAGTSDTLLLTLTPEDTVTDVVDVGTAVLVFTTTGTIYTMTIDDSLVMSVTGESSFIDEIPVMAANVSGVLGIVTAEQTAAANGRIARFYTAAVNQNLEVVDLQLIWQIGDRDTTEDLTPGSILATRDSIYVAVPDEGLETATAWRYYLPTGGYARTSEFGMTTRHAVASMVEAQDRLWAGITSEGLWMEQDTYVPFGYVIGPLADFFTAESKQWVQGEITGIAPALTEMVLYDSNDETLIASPLSTSWQYIVRVNELSDTTQAVDMVAKTGRYHTAKVELRSTDGTNTPQFLSYSFRAMPSPERDQLFRIPINISDQIEAPGYRAITVPGRGEAIREALLAYEGVDTLIETWRPPRKVQGIIEKFEEPVYTIPNRGSVGKVMYARIRGKRLSTGDWIATPTLGNSLGQDGLGLSTLGVGDQT